MNDVEEYQIQIKDSRNEKSLPSQVVIIPIMNSPIFPGMIAPIILSQEKFLPELDEQILKTGYVALNLVKGEYPEEEEDEERELDYDEDHEIGSGDIYKVGVLCKVVKKLKLPDGSVNVLVHGIKRYRAFEFISETPILKAKVEVFDDILEADEELDAYTRSVINQVKKPIFKRKLVMR
ncbi:MAG: LON peptidase substrate-binding domain-containing protein [Bacteriovoracaceae bacterium]